MRKIAEIRKDLNAKVAEVKALDPQKSENAEAIKLALSAIDDLMVELKQAEAVEAAEQKLAEQKLADMQKKAGRSFSLLRFLKGASEGNLSGLEAEVAEMGAEEYRRLGLQPQGYVVPSAFLRTAGTPTGQNSKVAAEGGNLVETMSARYVDVLKEKLVLSQLGATVLTDLVGNLPVITSQQIVASWGAEGDTADITKSNYAKVTMTPHRNFVYTAVSKDLLRQTSLDVENDLLNKMVDAHANLIESAAINGTGANNQPTGILNHNGVEVVAMGTNGGAITWKKIVELETKVNSKNANRGKLGYLTNAKVNGELKTIEKVANSARFLLEGSDLNGYKYEWSNLVPSNLTKGTAADKCSAMIFGNFQDLYIGQWGGLDIVIDGSSAATAVKGEIGLVINAWNDCLVAEPKSFAVIKDIVTA